MPKKKIIICFTGEPRSFRKGLSIRNKEFNKKNNMYGFDVESRYLMSFLNHKKKSNNKFKILKRLKYFVKDRTLKSIKFNPHKFENIFANIISQKHEILCELIKESENVNDSLIILTRTDWFFNTYSLNLIQKAIVSNKIIVPFLTEKHSEFEGIRYKPMFDQFMIIPGELIIKTIKAMEISIKIFLENQKQSKKQNLNIDEKRSNKIGMAPENLLGLGFALSQLDKKVIVIKNFEYVFKPDMYGTNSHNLIRDDAHIWMNLSLCDFTKKYLNYIKSVLSKLLSKLNLKS